MARASRNNIAFFAPSLALALLPLLLLPSIAGARGVTANELLTCGSFEHGKCPPMDAARKNKREQTAAMILAWLQKHAAASAEDVARLTVALGELGDKKLCAPVLDLVSKRGGNSISARTDLLMAAARLACKEATGPLIKLLGEATGQREKVLAAGALGLVGNASATTILVAQLTSKWPRLQAAAAQALGVVSDAKAIAPLLRVAGSAGMYPPARINALAALARLKAVDALPLATALVAATPRKIGRAALEVIAASPVKWTRPAIALGLRTAGLRDAAARAAMAAPHEELAKIALQQALSDGLDRIEREALLASLGVLVPPGAAGKLMQRLPDPKQLASAAQLAKAAQPAKADEFELIAIMKVLPRLGDRTVVPRLVRFLPSAAPEVANFVVYALENLTGKRLGMDVPAWQRHAGVEPDDAPTAKAGNGAGNSTP